MLDGVGSLRTLLAVMVCGAAGMGYGATDATDVARAAQWPDAPALAGVSAVSAHLPIAALAVTGVTVIDVTDGRRLPNQTVVVVGNRIQAVGPVKQVSVPKDARVVEAEGKYLVPGFWDMHVHPEEADLLDKHDRSFLANGVTGIRNAGSQIPLKTLLQRRQEIWAGTRVGPPRQILSGQSLAGPVPGCQRRETRDSFQTGPLRPQACVADSADAVRVVDSLKAAGADMIKLRAVSPALYFVLAATARRLGMPFGGHAGSLASWGMVPTLEASDSGANIIDHFNLNLMGPNGPCWGMPQKPGSPPADSAVSVEGCRLAADRFRHNNTWFVPTFYQLSQGGAAPRRAQAVWWRFWNAPSGDALRDTAAAKADHPGAVADTLGSLWLMQRLGMPILAGTDISDGVPQASIFWGLTLHAELAMYVAEGLTPLNALRSATLNPAKMLRATDSLGTVAPGKLADLVLLDADPLEDITNTTTIRAVVANGRYFDRAMLDQLLKE